MPALRTGNIILYFYQNCFIIVVHHNKKIHTEFIMKQKNNNLSDIQEKAVLSYLNKMWKILPYVFACCAIVETGLFVLISGNVAIENVTNSINRTWTLFECYLPTALSYIFYFAIRHSVRWLVTGMRRKQTCIRSSACGMINPKSNGQHKHSKWSLVLAYFFD